MINTFSDKKEFFVPTMIFIANSRDYFTFAQQKTMKTFPDVDNNTKYQHQIKL